MAVCTLRVDPEINLEELFSLDMQWLTVNGMYNAYYTVHSKPINIYSHKIDDVTIETVVTGNVANLSLQILSLSTSYAGQYTCQASIMDEDLSVSLEQSIDLTFTRKCC